MVFNKTKVENIHIELNGHYLQIVEKCNYLGLMISSSGSFTLAVKELKNKALGAYAALRSAFTNFQVKPHFFMMLFDRLVKPILLYGCEVWGAFGHKLRILNNLMITLLSNQKLPPEQLHIRACKDILRRTLQSKQNSAECPSCTISFHQCQIRINGTE